MATVPNLDAMSAEELAAYDDKLREESKVLDKLIGYVYQRRRLLDSKPNSFEAQHATQRLEAIYDELPDEAKFRRG